MPKSWRLIVTTHLLAALAFGQTPAGQITGRISDSSDAVIPGAAVAVTNTDTGLERRVDSNSAGYYTVALLPPGTYRIAVTRDGFKLVSRTGITLQVDQVARIDFVLDVGAVTESIEVRGAAPTVESDTAALGTVVTQKQILDISPFLRPRSVGKARCGGSRATIQRQVKFLGIAA